MNWLAEGETELWKRLKETDRPIVLYGMGNGADKILHICEEKGIPVQDVFASDGFVRGQMFHGKRVLSWKETKDRYGAENLIVLLAFASSLPDVLNNIRAIAAESELYAPDVPVFGNGLFDANFVRRHGEELVAARELLSDEESRRIFDLVIRYKLTGKIDLLLKAVSDSAAVMNGLIRPQELQYTADLGAYNGDTVRELLASGATPKRIYAVEPDMRNFKKLSAYAGQEKRCEVLPIRAAAWNKNEYLTFDGSGNRNASAEQNRSAVLSDRPVKTVEIPARSLDSILNGQPVDYIKYDVEGSEQQALEGSEQSIRNGYPTLLVSLYHRNEDLFALPLRIHREFPAYNQFYLRRFGGIPAWDLNLYVRREV